MGLVSNIISFIDFGLKIASGARNVRDSLHGTSADLHELELIVADVRTYNNQVKDQRHADHQLSNHERDILAMVKECDELTVELQKVIAKFKESWEMKYDAKMDVIRDQILLSVQQAPSNSATTQITQLASLKTKFDALKKEHLQCITQAEVMRSLYLPVLNRRRHQIPTADRSSNDWVFDESKTLFKPWLEGQKKHDLLFCITGRAGSGKSTLIKHISESPCTSESLQRWAGSARLHTASFFFWNQGDELQKNQIGLFQSLLYQIFRSARDLIPLVNSDRRNHEKWEVHELKATFKRIAGQTELDIKYCFFIDGLDEYSGDEEEVVEMLTFLSASNAIKICASTRPRSIFERYFCDTTLAFDIAKFTKADMMQHVHLQLQENENFRRLESTEPDCWKITSLIADLARGVWLWVFLVTRSH
ncbi:hypothetical protein TUN205_11655, partial [Pyrenophora tritici-repentis]